MEMNTNSSSLSEEMTIGELAARFGLATHVLRHWEAMGLLTPVASSRGAPAADCSGSSCQGDDRTRPGVLVRRLHAMPELPAECRDGLGGAPSPPRYRRSPIAST
jgi:hypothetical protein